MISRDRRLLKDMLKNAFIAENGTLGVSPQLFDETPSLKYVTLYALQIVGEAASKVSKEVKAKMPEVPWDEIVSTRHVIVHGYDGVNPETIFGIVADDRPPLVEAIRRFLASEGETP